MHPTFNIQHPTSNILLLSDKIIRFYKELIPPKDLPNDVEVLYPQKNEDVKRIIEIFYTKYFSDNNPRRFLFGINPGRFGSGTTGINFTAPNQLKQFCGIDHPFKQQSELSAEFIYEVIDQYGGPEKFYNDFFITAVSPLGFIKNGKNMNYYDDKNLQAALKPFIVESIFKQLDFGKNDYCICVGGEKNFRFFLDLNREYNFFKEIIPLPHPRFIMQYRRKKKQFYIDQYLSALRNDSDLKK